MDNKIGVVYFTRTGNAERIAQRINETIKGDIIQIKDDRKWKGFFGFMSGGRHAASLKHVAYHLEPEVDLESYSSIVLVTPMWAGNLTPATYSYLKDHPKVVGRTRLIIQSAGTDATQNAKKYEDYLGKFIKIYSIARSRKEEDSVIEQFLNDMK